MLEGQIQGQMRDPAAGCWATGCCPAMLPGQRAAALTLEGGSGRKRGRGWVGYGVHSGHEGESRGVNQNARVSPSLSIGEVYMLRGEGDRGHREP